MNATQRHGLRILAQAMEVAKVLSKGAFLSCLRHLETHLRATEEAENIRALVRSLRQDRARLMDETKGGA